MADSSPNAYEKQVDRLLASPRYGERWAAMWLDLARYADTKGYEADRERPGVWPYRDWVIDAFNPQPAIRQICHHPAGRRSACPMPPLKIGLQLPFTVKRRITTRGNR
jgi:hypothetical protein